MLIRTAVIVAPSQDINVTSILLITIAVRVQVLLPPVLLPPVPVPPARLPVLVLPRAVIHAIVTGTTDLDTRIVNHTKNLIPKEKATTSHQKATPQEAKHS